MWNECVRLIASAVVHYNSLILADVLQTLEKTARDTVAEAPKRISPLAWQHINFYGRYRFDNDMLSNNAAELAA